MSQRSDLEEYYRPILEALPNFAWQDGTGNGAANCPAHSDRHKSLSVKIGRDGELLLNCHADKGCSFDEIAAALGRPRGSGRMVDFFPPKVDAQLPNQGVKIERIYDYVSQAGEVVYQSLRGRRADGSKKVYQRRPDGQGGWVNDLDGVEQIPFHLPELAEANPSRTVFVVEGEPKVEALEEHGFVATCNAGGAEKWRLEWGPLFTGRPVAILPDHDESGWKHAWTVAQCLSGIGNPLRVVELPGIRLKEDVVDWFRRLKGDRAQRRRRLIRAVDNGWLWAPTRGDPALKLMHFRMEIARALVLTGAH